MTPEPPEITPELLQQNPVLAILLTFFSLFVLGGAVAAIGAWAWLLWRLRTGQPILESVPWRPRVWGLADLIAILIGFYFLQIAFLGLGVPALGVDIEAIKAGETPPMAFNAWLSLSNLCAVALAVGWIMLRFQVPISHIGWTRPTVKELAIGVVAGLIVIPVVYVVSAVVNLSFHEEYSHPILEALQSEATLASFLMACFVAVIAAPISEEFAFRVLLQGWLQSLPGATAAQALLGRINQPVSATRGEAVYVADGEPSAPIIAEPAEGESSSARTAGMTAPSPHPADAPDISISAAYAPPASTVPAEPNDVHGPQVAPAWAPLVSGTLFGLAHWGYGLSFVPLILFGIALGFVYRARCSIWPCIVMHVMLNATSMIAMAVQVMLLRATSGG
ncbi:MAG: CPBP family intramembrane metalloprotease [Planctomycetota bacterium]|nr:MAG: CPBP family intramembrane metalloprotease [Planctomycetota bacterium]